MWPKNQLYTRKVFSLLMWRLFFLSILFLRFPAVGRKPSHTLSSCHCQVVEKAFLLHSVPRGHGNLLTLLMTDGKSNVRAVIAEQECDRLRWESVARLTVNRPVKSDIRFQSSPLSSLQQLPWEPKCHFSPLFVYLIFPKPFIPFY